MTTRIMRLAATASLLAATVLASSSVFAQDALKLAVGQRGLWDTGVSEIGQRAGIFKKHGLTLEILYTQGAGETQQAVISGSVDIGVGVGVMGVLSAFSKGAPVRIISSEITGAGDLFWYVKADSPIKELKDASGTIAYSTNGSSTHGVVTAFVQEYSIKARPTATGGPPGTLTQVMSGQVDVGWSAPPFGLDQLEKKEIRILATGNAASAFKGQAVRLNIANAQALQTKKSAVDRYMAGYRETIEYMYSNPAALKVYAEYANITEGKAKLVRDQFFPREALQTDEVKGLDIIMPDAIKLKFLGAPLTKEQIAELIQIPGAKK